MLPTIAPGTPVEIVCGNDANPGDVILFLHRGQVVVHRLIAKQRGWLLARGDANPIPDLPVAADALIGRAVSVAAWSETKWQSFNRLLIVSVFRLAPPLVRYLVPLLWQVRRVVLASRHAATPS
jgi:hypothetical protein